MKTYLIGIALMIATLAVAGCSSSGPERQAWRSPELDPRQFFSGLLCADGVVKGFSGEQIRQFNALIRASWDASGTGTLDEVFYFYDDKDQPATEEKRVWTLKPVPEGYLASATDVPDAALMRYAGNTIHMAYTLRYGEPGDTIDLSMDDRMYQVADGVVVNETRMKKFGVESH